MSIASGTSRAGAGGATEVSERRAAANAKGATGFFTMITGQLESGEFQTLDNMYVKFKFVYGPDWKAVGGPDQGTSQTSRKGSTDDDEVVWNFPIDVALKATSAYGWPRLVLSVYRQDSFGRDIIQGYGSMLVPTVAGRYTRYVRMFAPVSSSPFQSMLVWLTGNKPEFYHPEFVARSDGREVTRVEAAGLVKVSVNVMTRGMSAFGYATGGPADAGAAPTAGAGAGAGAGGRLRRV